MFYRFVVKLCNLFENIWLRNPAVSIWPIRLGRCHAGIIRRTCTRGRLIRLPVDTVFCIPRRFFDKYKGGGPACSPILKFDERAGGKPKPATCQPRTFKIHYRTIRVCSKEFIIAKYLHIYTKCQFICRRSNSGRRRNASYH